MSKKRSVIQFDAFQEQYFPQVDALFKIGFGFEEDLPAKLNHSSMGGMTTSCVAIYRHDFQQQNEDHSAADNHADDKNDDEYFELESFDPQLADMDGQVVGFHLLYAPNCWQPQDFPLEFNVSEYSYGLDQLGFCEAVAVHPRMQQRGIGKKMYVWSEKKVRQLNPNCKGFITHVWTESSGALPLSKANSSSSSKAGGVHRIIKIHKNAWRQYYLDCGLVCNFCNAICCCTSAECETLFNAPNEK
ncbi:hypothetical protein C9374_007413 [Naegleria lovaniensis]|uniref:N-acetyltransferase domain-containing protein n=1 Tax=Naegleria lovaniensis TaxID=51637 RepID=A0AA88KLT7_NAELO|nr:uncharacterized protein C9374_007413 [Naegleria lovaniensis]KAG2379274.1 hypothetical protein C9374_007413 [Naegleria lovaniensis]